MRSLEQVHQSLHKELGDFKTEKDTLNMAFVIKVENALIMDRTDYIHELMQEYKTIDERINSEFHKRIGEIAV